MLSIMPPRIRTRATKALKENICVKDKSKAKTAVKAPRKVLGDKTNSASDENVSPEVPVKTNPVKTKKIVTVAVEKHIVKDVRPRRDRRLPTRYVENKVLTNLSNSKDNPTSPTPLITLTPMKVDIIPPKIDEPKSSPFKTPSKVESSLIANRPKRICRLPSRFEDHSISPNKYIPIQPSNASTPIQQNKAKALKDIQTNKDVNKSKSDTQSPKVAVKPVINSRPARAAKNAALQKKLSDSSTNNSSPDTNNNAKGRPIRSKKIVKKPSPVKTSPNKITLPKKLREKNLSFKVLENKKKTDDSNESNLDVYEFTYDPNEEPKPQKKKRKNVTKKRPPKPKTVIIKSSYDQNINKALSALKSAVAKIPSQPVSAQTAISEQNVNKILKPAKEINQTSNTNTYSIADNNKSNPANETGKSVYGNNYPSIRVEDIAADIEPSVHHYDDINYSPVNSPHRAKSPTNTRLNPEPPINVKDPLNLQEDFSFFDDQPVASSSMNMSVRHPLASPWRVEFGSLPIKWHVNTYVKANMTPAVESSFISSSDSIKKRHVYTNIMAPQPNETLPEIVTNTSNLKQTSIISFIKEVAERNAKKKRGRSVSPTKYNSLFEDAPKTTNIEVHKTSKKQTNKDIVRTDVIPENNELENVENNSKDTSEDKENSKETRRETRKRKNIEAISDKPTKSPRKQKNKDCTYFGFDDSENQEQENVSPLKVKNPQVRSLRPRTRPALQELNSQTGPMRAVLPVAAKTKIASSSDALNRMYEDPKSAADAPIFPEKETQPLEKDVTNVDDELLNDDSQSVHLFEDIDVVHHLKPTRKSYGKAKKVTFRQRSMSDSDSRTSDVEQNESSEDDLADLTFEVPNVKEKKTKKKKPKKKLMSKKEEKEAEEWAAGFNSMCEDIEEFPLLVE